MEIIIIAILGLCIGSFLNVCIYRIPRRLSLIKPLRSFCPTCKTQLGSLENIPVISWMFLRAKCKHCSSPISGQYPLVEILSCFAAVASYLQFASTPTAFLVYCITATLIVITFIDLEFMIIPNVINYPGMVIGLLLGITAELFYPFSRPITSGALDSLLGFIIGGGFFHVVGYIYFKISGRDGIGGGDIKLLAFTGAALGFKSVLPTIFAGSLFGAVAGLVTILIRGGGRHSELPFGPWLAIGAVIYMFVDYPLFRIF